jgi:hypothetical protein
MDAYYIVSDNREDRQVSEVHKSKPKVSILKCIGVVHPRNVLDAPSLIANLALTSRSDLVHDIRLARLAGNDSVGGMLVMSYEGGAEVP